MVSPTYQVHYMSNLIKLNAQHAFRSKKRSLSEFHDLQ